MPDLSEESVIVCLACGEMCERKKEKCISFLWSIVNFTSTLMHRNIFVTYPSSIDQCFLFLTMLSDRCEAFWL